MTRMMAGTLTEEETERVVELMNRYPGPNALMMNRLGGTGWHMGVSTPWWSLGAWLFPFLFFLNALVWLGVGVLVLAWLWRQVTR